MSLMKSPIAKILGVLALIVVLAASAWVLSSYEYDTVTFVPVGHAAPAAAPEPSVQIRTDMKMSGMFGGTVKSIAPYSIGIDYTDETFTFSEAEITKVVVEYEDGTNDPRVAALKSPLRLPARPHESINSVSGGRIVKTEQRVISGTIPDVVSFDKPVTILIEGHFRKDDGAKILFVIRRKYDVVKDKGTKSWFDVMEDC